MLYIKTQKKDMVLEFHGAYAREEEYIEKQDENGDDVKAKGFFVGLVGIGAIAKYDTLERAMEVYEEMLINIPQENNVNRIYTVPEA